MKPIANIETPAVQHGFGWLQRIYRKWVLDRLSRIDIQPLRILDQQEVYDIGATSNVRPIIVDVHHPGFWSAIALRGSLGAAESYMNGYWDCNDLLQLIRRFSCSSTCLDALDEKTPGLYKWIDLVDRQINMNSLGGSRRNIAKHYDLGNRFFELFLDRHMMYSAAIYPTQCSSLEAASTNKLRTIAEKLEIRESDHLLEIGSGWGGLAIYMAKKHGCRVTTTTISGQQYAYASKKVAESGLQQQVTVLKQDYRQLTGQYNKIASIEMIEAVGQRYLPDYFQACDRLATRGGKLLIQTITMPEQRYEQAARQIDFIQKYIFPGGFLPSMETILHHTGQYTRYQLRGFEDITHSYALTLADWHKRFKGNLQKIRDQGFSDNFIRMWEYYLCYCEAGFSENAIGTSQILFEKHD